MFATVCAARICDLTASLPCCLFFLPWLYPRLAFHLPAGIHSCPTYSLTMMNGLPDSSFIIWAIFGGVSGGRWRKHIKRVLRIRERTIGKIDICREFNVSTVPKGMYSSMSQILGPAMRGHNLLIAMVRERLLDQYYTSYTLEISLLQSVRTDR